MQAAVDDKTLCSTSQALSCPSGMHAQDPGEGRVVPCPPPACQACSVLSHADRLRTPASCLHARVLAPPPGIASGRPPPSPFIPYLPSSHRQKARERASACEDILCPERRVRPVKHRRLSCSTAPPRARASAAGSGPSLPSVSKPAGYVYGGRERDIW